VPSPAWVFSMSQRKKGRLFVLKETESVDVHYNSSGGMSQDIALQPLTASSDSGGAHADTAISMQKHTPPATASAPRSHHTHHALPYYRRSKACCSSCCCGCLHCLQRWSGIVVLLLLLPIFIWLLILSSKVKECQQASSQAIYRYGVLASGELARPSHSGDSHALSLGWLQLELGRSRLCYNLLIANYSSMPTAVVLHGPMDDFSPEYAPPFLELPWPNTTVILGYRLSACQAHVSAFFLESIVHDPSAYYLVISSQDYPKEAARGYLKGVWPQ